MLLLILGVVTGLVIGWLVLHRRKPPAFLSTNEYWVYLPKPKMPPQAAVMRLVLAGDRYARDGHNPITPSEGMLMSDTRLHIALVLRTKNPHAFRPDLFEEHVEPTQEILETLSASQAFAKVSYISDQPLKNCASVQLLPHLADAVAELGRGRLIYDCMKEELIARDSFKDMLAEHFDLDDPGIQVRSIWRRSDQGGWGETRGLRKIGLPELATEPMESDEQVLVLEVLDEAARQLWEAGTLLDKVEARVFEDRFQVLIAPPRDRVSHARIMRIQAQ